MSLTELFTDAQERAGGQELDTDDCLVAIVIALCDVIQVGWSTRDQLSRIADALDMANTIKINQR